MTTLPHRRDFPSIEAWADAVSGELAARFGDPASRDIIPQPVALAHYLASHASNLGIERAGLGGVLMFDPVNDSVLMSTTTGWKLLEDRPRAADTYVLREHMPIVTPEMHGAVGDGATDDTVAIQNAIAAAEATGAKLLLGPKPYLVSGSGAAIFTISKPIHILGCGYESIILLSSAVPVTRDVFLFQSSIVANGQAYAKFADFRITGQSIGVGRHGIAIVPLNNTYLFRCGIEGIEFRNLAGWGVWIDGIPATATAINTGWVRDCRFICGGFGAQKLYDSWVIENTQFTGNGFYAMDVGFVDGCGRFTVKDCNITSSSGVKIRGEITSLVLENNYFETLYPYTGTGGAFIDLAATSADLISDAVIVKNLFTILNNMGDPNALRLEHVRSGIVAQNNFNVIPAASYGIDLTANTWDVHIAADNIWHNVGAGRILNRSLRATGESKVLVGIIEDAEVVNTSTTSSFGKNLIIPALTLKPGDAIRLKASGLYSTVGSTQLSLYLIFGGATVYVQHITLAAAATNQIWNIESTIVIRSIGSSGVMSRAPGTGSAATAAGTASTNTTVAAVGYPSVKWATADPGNSARLTQFSAELLEAHNIV